VGLRSISDSIEHLGTGGGLCRPIYADFLEEAAGLLEDRRLGELGRRYAELGSRWSALADLALPEEFPAFRETKQLLSRKAELAQDRAEHEAEQDSCMRLMGEWVERMKREFPLDGVQSAALRRELKTRVNGLVDDERAALRELGAWSGAG
jgi:hypothetical protein